MSILACVLGFVALVESVCLLVLARKHKKLIAEHKEMLSNLEVLKEIHEETFGPIKSKGCICETFFCDCRCDACGKQDCICDCPLCDNHICSCN